MRTGAKLTRWKRTTRPWLAAAGAGRAGSERGDAVGLGKRRRDAQMDRRTSMCRRRHRRAATAARPGESRGGKVGESIDVGSASGPSPSPSAFDSLAINTLDDMLLVQPADFSSCSGSRLRKRVVGVHTWYLVFQPALCVYPSGTCDVDAFDFTFLPHSTRFNHVVICGCAAIFDIPICDPLAGFIFNIIPLLDSINHFLRNGLTLLG
jgi:hypothetical protein